MCLTYKNPHPNGLPTNAEYEPVKALEDKLQEFAKNNEDWYVGRVTVAGHRYFYIYTSAPEETWIDFVTALNKEFDYELKTVFRDDKDRRGYWED